MAKIQPHHLHVLNRLQTSHQRVDEKATSTSFQNLLNQEIGSTADLKLSKHAKQRLSERNLHIEPKEWQTISQRVQEAKGKGITDSVVVTKNAALLVNTTNQTVITAMGRKEASTHLFSNINGAILID